MRKCVLKGVSVLKRRKIAAILAAFAALLCGCGANSDNQPSGKESVSEESSLPFDDYFPEITPDTPALTYLGTRDLRNSEALKLYSKTFAADYKQSDILVREYCSEYRLADVLSEKMASDRSPDLTDKLPNSFPYLMSKNYYEDLTKYIDRSAPQWTEYASYIDFYSYNGGHFFYPETVTAAPRFLVYSKERFEALGLSDPETLFYDGKWTRKAFTEAAKSFCAAMGGTGVYGDGITDGFISSEGETLFSKAESGQLVCNLGSEKVTEIFDYLKNELSAKTGIESFTGYDRIINGRSAFLLVDESGYNELLAIDSGKNYGAVPIPKSDESELYFCAASGSGFLVPKGAKNVKGAACFINCGRIAAAQSEAEAPESVLGKMRANGLTAVPEENYCFDKETNSAINECLSFPLTAEGEEYVYSSGLAKIEAAVAEINSLN